MSIAKSRKKQLDYARRRESERLLWINLQDRNLSAEISEIMDYAMETVLRESQGWLVKYAMTENISLVEARKRVSTADMDYLERKAERYVSEKDFSPRANQEMRLYNYTMKMSRHELLLRHMDLELLGAYSDVDKLMAGYLSEMSTEELIRQAGLLGKSIKGVDQYAKQIANSSFYGATFSDRIWENQKVLTQRLGEGLTKALKTGKHPTTWMRDLRGNLTESFSGATYALKRLAVTESARVQIEAQKAAYEANGYSQFMVICEPTACELCTPYDGRVAPVKNMMVGANAPPFHPNCKCSTSAYEDRLLPEGEELIRLVDNEEDTGYNLFKKANRREQNIGAFKHLEVPMQKREVLRIARKHGIDLKGITVKIQRGESWIASPYLGRADMNQIGRIDLLPNAFSSEDQIVSTLLHEKCHVLQAQKYGVKFVQENIAKMEEQAERFETFWFRALMSKRRQQ